jgi:hypothetical protein
LAEGCGVGTHGHPTRLEGYDVHGGFVFRVRYAATPPSTQKMRILLYRGDWSDEGPGTTLAHMPFRHQEEENLMPITGNIFQTTGESFCLISRLGERLYCHLFRRSPPSSFGTTFNTSIDSRPRIHPHRDGLY